MIVDRSKNIPHMEYNFDINKPDFKVNDLNKVYAHYDEITHTNVTTKNELRSEQDES